MSPRDHHYDFAHRLLPHEVLLGSFVEDFTARGDDALRDRWDESGRRSPLRLPPVGLFGRMVTLRSGRPVLLITLPRAAEPPEAHFVAVAWPAAGEPQRLRYLTLERAGGGHQATMLCEWIASGEQVAHAALAEGPPPAADDFLAALEAHLDGLPLPARAPAPPPVAPRRAPSTARAAAASGPGGGVRLRGLGIFLGSLVLSVGVVYAIAHWQLSGRGVAAACALPFVGMVYGLGELLSGHRFGELDAWFGRLPLAARIPLGCLVVPALLAGCGLLVFLTYRLVAPLVPAGGISIYVDNAHARALEVRIDGRAPVPVPASGVAVVKTGAGPHRVEVREEGRLVYEGQPTFPEGERKVILNPDRERRYVVQTVYYGNVRPAPDYGIPPGIQYDANRALANLRLAAPDPWVMGPFDALFEERPPETVTRLRGEVATPTRVRACRISAEDHALVSRAAEEARRPPLQPLLADKALADAINRTLSACR